MKSFALIVMSGLLALPAVGGAPPASAAADFYVAGDGPPTLQAGLSGTYVVTVANNGDTSAPVELIIVFTGKLEQTGQISAGGGFDCEVRRDAGINAAVRCTVQQLPSAKFYKIVVQGRGSAPGTGQLTVTINPDRSIPEDGFANNFFQQNVTIT